MLLIKKVLLPFEFTDYKAYLRARANAEWGAISKLADAAGCQRSYLSRVLGSEVHLTMDQAFGISEYLKLSENECSYFLGLVEMARAGTPGYRRRLEANLKRLRHEYNDLQKRVARPAAAQSAKEFTYYSTWIYSAVHIIASIPEYQTSATIAKRLQLPVEMVERTLNELQEWGLTKFQDRRWRFGDQEIHVTKASPLSVLHHTNWRQRAVLDAQIGAADSIHFSVVQSVDRAAWKHIRAQLLLFIEDAARVARPSQEEILICLATDLFEV